MASVSAAMPEPNEDTDGRAATWSAGAHPISMALNPRAVTTDPLTAWRMR
jgi:hypothetical protein